MRREQELTIWQSGQVNGDKEHSVSASNYKSPLEVSGHVFRVRQVGTVVYFSLVSFGSRELKMTSLVLCITK